MLQRRHGDESRLGGQPGVKSQGGSPGDDILLTVTAESGFPALIEWMIRDRESHSVVWNAVQERKGRTAQDVDQMTISLSESELILAAPRK